MNNKTSEWQKKDNLKKRLYLLAKRKGLALQLCRKRDGVDHDTFRILNRTSGVVVHSARPGGYGLTLDQVEDYLAHHSAKEQVGTKQTIIKRTATEVHPKILKSMTPAHKQTVSHKAIPTARDPSKEPRETRTMNLADINVALLKVVAKNLQEAIKRDTKQLGLVRSMIENAENAQ